MCPTQHITLSKQQQCTVESRSKKHTHTYRDIHRHRDTERHTETYRGTHTEAHIHTETYRETHREKDTQTAAVTYTSRFMPRIPASAADRLGGAFPCLVTWFQAVQTNSLVLAIARDVAKVTCYQSRYDGVMIA